MSLKATNQSSRMKLDDFDMIRTLGTGSFGRVKYAKSKIDGQYYAVKYMKKHDIIKLKQGMVSPLSDRKSHISRPHKLGKIDHDAVESPVHRKLAGVV